MTMKHALPALVLAFAAQSGLAAEDGARLFKNACGTCHSSNAGHRIGPSLLGLSGRLSGTALGFEGYSPAMQKAAITWDAALLDRFLAAPGAVVKGTEMSYPGLKNEAERKAIVDYVLQLKAP
ncbi:MAG: c-type cytochrome [Pseudomonadota bacterium]